jgi:hypothetical protein
MAEKSETGNSLTTLGFLPGIMTSEQFRIATLIAPGGCFQADVAKKLELAFIRPPARNSFSRLRGNAKRLCCALLVDEMQPGAVLFPHLFCRNNPAPEVRELHKLVLDCL